MAKKVIYQITRYKVETLEVESEEQEVLVKELNRDFERMEKADKTYRARCSSLDYMRENGSFEIIDEKQQSPEERLMEEESQRETKAQIHRAIGKLTPRQQEMVRMVYFEEKSQDEVARYYGITKQSVSDAMRRIYATMRKILEKN